MVQLAASKVVSEIGGSSRSTSTRRTGVLWKQIGGSWFVGGVFAGEAADAAGLRVGDEVLSSDGAPFGPVRAFSGKAGATVLLTVRRTKEGAPTAVTVRAPLDAASD